MTFNVGPVPEGFLPKTAPDKNQTAGGAAGSGSPASKLSGSGSPAGRRNSSAFGQRINTSSQALNSAYGHLKRLSKRVKFKTPAGLTLSGGGSSANALNDPDSGRPLPATHRRLRQLIDDDTPPSGSDPSYGGSMPASMDQLSPSTARSPYRTLESSKPASGKAQLFQRQSTESAPTDCERLTIDDPSDTGIVMLTVEQSSEDTML